MTSKTPNRYDARAINSQYQKSKVILSIIQDSSKALDFNKACDLLKQQYPSPNIYQQELVAAYTSRLSSTKVIAYHRATGWIIANRVQVKAIYDPSAKPVSDANAQRWVEELINGAEAESLTIYFSTYAQYIALRHVNILGYVHMPCIEISGKPHALAADGMAFENSWPQDFDVRNIDRLFKLIKGPDVPPVITESTPMIKFVITDGDEEAVGDEAVEAWYQDVLKTSPDTLRVATASQFKQLCLGIRFGELQQTSVDFNGKVYQIDSEACVIDRPDGLFDIEHLLINSEASIIGITCPNNQAQKF